MPSLLCIIYCRNEHSRLHRIIFTMASKSVNDVAVGNYDVLIEAVASIISDHDDLLLRRLISLNVITSDNKQLIRNEKTNILQAECLLDKFILNRVHSGEDEVLFTLLDVLGETGKCNDVVTKICTELDRPLPQLGQYCVCCMCVYIWVYLKPSILNVT